MDPFVIRVILSFIVGGLYIGGVIWVSERFGTKIGAILAGIPNTLLISFIFIGLTSGNAALHKAALILPAMFLPILIFFYVFSRVVAYSAELAVASASIAWFLISWTLVHAKISNIAINIVIGLTGMVLARFITRNYPKNLKSKIRAPRNVHIVRVLAAGTAIATAVIVAHKLGPEWGGVFSLYPAAVASMFYMLSRSHDKSFIEAITRQMSFSVGASLIFSVIFYLLILHIGLGLSLIAGMIAAILYAISLQKFTA